MSGTPGDRPAEYLERRIMKTLFNDLKVSTPKLREMGKGETRVFTERQNEPPGAPTQGLATSRGVGIKVTTKQCWIVVPRSNELLKAVLVTKLN